ncbi:hypothetical protein [Halorarum halobium]|uniref:hypothetical protein n=1 Tax=Halorarum halobium TaxID=3075121 RepID=UPI0028A88E26|nr:hypothetical protein [Halobaculum sp. XH14]
MRSSRGRRRGRAKIALGLSILFAVGLVGYFALAGTPVTGMLLGILVVGAGGWEYRRTLQDVRTAERYEAEAEASAREGRR